MKHFVLVAVFCAAGGQPQGLTEKPDPRSELPSAIQHALQLLEDEKYALFLDQFSIPAELKRAVESRDLEDLASAFAKEKAKITIAVLEQIKDTDPKKSEDGNLAEYAVEVKNFPREKIVFEKIDGLWYIRN